MCAFESIIQVTPSSLLGLNNKCEVIEGDGRVQREAATIHKSVHDERKDALCCIHLHMSYATAVGEKIKKLL